jgi:hypothetical protein
MPSSIPKPRRHLPRSRELDCPVCGQVHTPFSCVSAEQVTDERDGPKEIKSDDGVGEGSEGMTSPPASCA